jgi:hypothetical protein
MLIKNWEYWEYNLSIGQMALSSIEITPKSSCNKTGEF